MKLTLPTVEDTDRLNYRIPLSVKAELDDLAERCKRAKLDFNVALAEGLRSVAKAIREQLDARTSKRGAKVGVSAAPDSSTNGALTMRKTPEENSNTEL